MNVLPAFGAVLLVASACCLSTARAEGPHWSYKGHGGPGEWGELDKEFATCGSGKLQSPIDIRGAKTSAELPAIRFNYQPVPLQSLENDHTLQVNYPPGSFMEVGGKRYELVQFHFHKPSEEKVNGKAHDMVAHLVHKDADGKLAVVAVLLDKGGANDTIDTIWRHRPKHREEVYKPGVIIDASKLLPVQQGYYTFDGSLTTPPCSEGVRWFVLKSPTKIGTIHVDAFGRVYPMTARPTQPLNGRAVTATP